MKKKPRKRRLWLRVLMILMLIGMVFEGAMMLSVHIAGARSWPLGDADVAIVLGARVMPNGLMSTTLDYRVKKALELYEDGRVRAIIVCGAQGSDEPMTEAEAMHAFLTKNNVPDSDIIREDQSTDTIENIRHSMAIMAERGYERAIVVTSEYHLTRALWIARDQGLDALGAPAPGPDTLPKQIEANFRETLSWMNYWTGGLLARISGL